MTPDRAAWLLAYPLDDPRTADLDPYRTVDRQRDGALLVTVLAVDR
jgi:hypothetical protein